MIGVPVEVRRVRDAGCHGLAERLTLRPEPVNLRRPLKKDALSRSLERRSGGQREAGEVVQVPPFPGSHVPAPRLAAGGTHHFRICGDDGKKEAANLLTAPPQEVNSRVQLRRAWNRTMARHRRRGWPSPPQFERSGVLGLEPSQSAWEHAGSRGPCSLNEVGALRADYGLATDHSCRLSVEGGVRGRLSKLRSVVIDVDDAADVQREGVLSFSKKLFPAKPGVLP